MVTWLARRSFDLKVKPRLEPGVGRHVVQGPYTPSCILNDTENIVLEWTNIPSTKEHPHYQLLYITETGDTSCLIHLALEKILPKIKRAESLGF